MIGGCDGLQQVDGVVMVAAATGGGGSTRVTHPRLYWVSTTTPSPPRYPPSTNPFDSYKTGGAGTRDYPPPRSYIYIAFDHSGRGFDIKFFRLYIGRALYNTGQCGGGVKGFVWEPLQITREL